MPAMRRVMSFAGGYQIVHMMANALEQNPEAASIKPPFPTSDGEWP
jgi:hypothetical protein